MNNTYIWTMIAVMALVTALLRFLPFIIFSNNQKTPKTIEKLSSILPFAIMGMLVVYCMKSISFTSVAGFLPMLIAGAIVVALHVWKRSTLISIIGGTVIYMLMVQLIF